MGTSLSFHNRYLYATNRLVFAALIIIVLSLLNTHQISCAAIGLPNSLTMDEPVRSIRHSKNNRRKIDLQNQNAQSLRTQHNSDSNVYTNSNDYYFGIFSIKNSCSERYMTIYSGNISAEAKRRGDTGAQIQFQKVPGVEKQFYIKRKDGHRYVCLTRRGKLILLVRPTRDDRCSFTRIPIESSTQSDNRYDKIQSVANNLWYIGFRKNGKPMKAWKHGLKSEKCFQFEIERYSSSQPQSPTPLLRPILDFGGLDYGS